MRTWVTCGPALPDVVTVKQVLFESGSYSSPDNRAGLVVAEVNGKICASPARPANSSAPR